MEARNIWMVGLWAAGLVSFFGLTSVLTEIEKNLSEEVNNIVNRPQFKQQLKAVVHGQSVTLSTELKGDDAKYIFASAQKFLANLTLEKYPYLNGSALEGPISIVKFEEGVFYAEKPISGPPLVSDINLSASAYSSHSSHSDMSSMSEEASGIAKSEESHINSKKTEGSTFVKRVLTKEQLECEQSLKQYLAKSKVVFGISDYKLVGSSVVFSGNFARKFLSCPGNATLYITGHTDWVGDEETNRLVSLARAQSFANALIKQGIPADRIVFEGLGDSKPIGDNSTRSGRQKNRSIDVELIINP